MRPELTDENPYFVLGLQVPASAGEVERSKSRLLAIMEAKGKSTHRYDTPMGSREASADAIRKAARILAEPRERLWRGLWADRLRREPPSGPKEQPAESIVLEEILEWWS